MKPSDHPEFFRFPAPEGRSRESTIRLDAEGHFWHDGRRVEHAGLSAALHSWIARHPDDGRYILTNGYDWTYFAVDDAPFVVRAIRLDTEHIVLLLSDGTEEDWAPEDTRAGADGALYARVKPSAQGGPFEAKFSRHAQASLAPALVPMPLPPEIGGGEQPGVRIGARVHAIGAKGARFE
jgi:hypothetical protein